MGYRRRQIDKQRNLVARDSKHRGGPHGPSTNSTDRMRVSKELKDISRTWDSVEDKL